MMAIAEDAMRKIAVLRGQLDEKEKEHKGLELEVAQQRLARDAVEKEAEARINQIRREKDRAEREKVLLPWWAGLFETLLLETSL
jgi:hypothetical protein